MTVYLWGFVRWVSAQHNRTAPIRYQKEMRTKPHCKEAGGLTQTQQNSENYFGKYFLYSRLWLFNLILSQPGLKRGKLLIAQASGLHVGVPLRRPVQTEE